jgi:hypothetical protein
VIPSRRRLCDAKIQRSHNRDASFTFHLRIPGISKQLELVARGMLGFSLRWSSSSGADVG